MIRIAAIGPESSGKTTLCRELAASFHTLFVPEYAREYLQNKKQYTQEDVLKMLEGQIALEKAIINKCTAPLIFCDTEPINFKVWMEHVYGESHGSIDQLIMNHPYDLYLLLSPDIPWEYDPLRENKEKGDFFFNWYRHILDAFKLPYVVITGNGKSRTKNAIIAIQNKFPELGDSSKK